MKLRARVVKVQSAFYADAGHFVGNRVVLALVGDEVTARRSVQQIKAYAERQVVVDERPAAVPAPGRAAASVQATARPPVARFCPACGTPVLAGARFCQSCRASLLHG